MFFFNNSGTSKVHGKLSALKADIVHATKSMADGHVSVEHPKEFNNDHAKLIELEAELVCVPPRLWLTGASLRNSLMSSRWAMQMHGAGSN